MGLTVCMSPACVQRPECLEHAMQCFARLVRVVLGADAIENKKLDYGMSLVVLGAEISFKPDCFSVVFPNIFFDRA